MMKTGLLVTALAALLIAVPSAAREHRGDASGHYDRRHHDNSYPQYRNRNHDRRHSDRDHHDRGRHHRADRRGEYFVGGLILGSLAHGYYTHNSRHESRHYTYGDTVHSHRHHDYVARTYYATGRHGQCYRVEERAYGDKVYVQVPKYRCY